MNNVDKRFFSQKPFFSFFILFVAVLSLSGCDLSRNYLKADRAGNMDAQDYRDALEPRFEEEDAVAGRNADMAGIPDLQSYTLPPAEDLTPMPLVSVEVNQTVPLRDVLYDLARQAGFDIELDPRIRGSVIFTAREKPFDLVVERLSEIAGLRYKIDDNSIRIELDRPYNKTYKIDYLSYVRSNASSVHTDVSVVTGEGADTGSTFGIEASSESDFWGEMASGLTQILGVSESHGRLKTSADPQITSVAPNPAPVGAVVAEGGEVTVQPPETVLNVSALPPVSAEEEEDDSQSISADSRFSLNKQAGLISVYASERQHKEIDAYLKEVRRSVTAQVLIEAKVFEVNLTDEFATGIDWALLDGPAGSITGGFNSSPVRPLLDPVAASDLAVSYLTNDFSAAIEAVSRFGTVRALASPRMTVLNNQSAVLNVSRNEVYFELDIDVTQATDASPAQVEVDSTVHTVPEGVLINVQPSINLDSREVSMAVRPTITRIVDTKPDPAVTYLDAAGLESSVPVVNVQEMDTVVSIDSGETIVMGGLMQDRADSTQEGIPVLGEVPIFGSLFRTQEDKIQKTELVVFLKATILDGSRGSVHKTDTDLYKKFSGDRRPLEF